MVKSGISSLESAEFLFNAALENSFELDNGNVILIPLDILFDFPQGRDSAIHLDVKSPTRSCACSSVPAPTQRYKWPMRELGNRLFKA